MNSEQRDKEARAKMVSHMIDFLEGPELDEAIKLVLEPTNKYLSMVPYKMDNLFMTGLREAYSKDFTDFTISDAAVIRIFISRMVRWMYETFPNDDNVYDWIEEDTYKRALPNVPHEGGEIWLWLSSTEHIVVDPDELYENMKEVRDA